MSINVTNNTMTRSAECLRKAVPLMVKYTIAVTHSNYALWYTYVSGNHLKLNEKLNSAYQEISRLQDELAHSQQAATTDALTGLLNKGSFNADIQLLCGSDHSKFKLFLTFVDIGHFKLFNDNFGHKKGDKAFSALVERSSVY